MSELPVDAVEQSSAAPTSETVKMDVDAPAPADKVEEKKENGASEEAKNEEKAEEKVEAKSESNGEKKDEKKEDEKPKKNGASDRKYNNNNKYDKQKTFNRYSKARSESKFDPSVLPETDDPSLIRAQVEFYFGDANLPTDKFMWEMTQGTKNIPVPISKIASFKRMQRFQPYSAVVAALKESNSLEVEGEEGLETVKRKVAYDPNFRPGQAAMARSIYAKGFGDEEPTTQFDIEAFFSPYGPINVVRLRRTEEKLFKGSVFVEFAEEDLAKKFLALDPKPKWKGEYDLQITSKLEYTSAKAQDIRDGKLEPNQTRPKPFNGNKESGDFRGRGRGRGHHRGGDRRGDRDPDDWKKRREDDQKSGFKDHRGGRGKGGRGGRGGRDDRGHRNNDRNDRNREREEKKNGDGEKTEPKAEPKAEGQSENNEKTETKTETKAEAQSENNEKKRPREEGATDEAPPAKKVDTKSEVTAEAS